MMFNTFDIIDLSSKYITSSHNKNTSNQSVKCEFVISVQMVFIFGFRRLASASIWRFVSIILTSISSVNHGMNSPLQSQIPIWFWTYTQRLHEQTQTDLVLGLCRFPQASSMNTTMRTLQRISSPLQKILFLVSAIFPTRLASMISIRRTSTQSLLIAASLISGCTVDLEKLKTSSIRLDIPLSFLRYT